VEPAQTDAAPEPAPSHQARMGVTPGPCSSNSTSTQTSPHSSPGSVDPPPPPEPSTAECGSGLMSGTGPGWHRQLNNWAKVAAKFNIPQNRYVEFQYLLYLDIADPYVENYVQFHMHEAEPNFTVSTDYRIICHSG
jgi:hypothetical protein